MENHLQLSLIVPVYNRPDEIKELLESLSQQDDQRFEVVIVEDGSDVRCESAIAAFKPGLEINYYYKPNTGPGQSRNYGCARAKGNYFIVLDSDCILPAHYISTVYAVLSENYFDAFGGPDKAHHSFSVLQKAINYAMTSFITTGGIRGGGKKFDRFYPRSFNMGFSKEVFEKTKGFPEVRYAASKAAGEDIEFSQNIYAAGFKISLISEAYVYHKRRTSVKAFFKQVYNFGYARISLYKRNRNNLKAVHFFPALFLIGCLLLIALSLIFSLQFLWPILALAALLLLDATIRNRSIRIGLVAMAMSFIQLYGYGYGFIKSFWNQVLLSKPARFEV